MKTSISVVSATISTATAAVFLLILAMMSASSTISTFYVDAQSTVAVTVPTIEVSPVIVAETSYFYPSAKNWRVFIGPNANTSGVAQNWPAGTTADEDEITPRLFCMNPLSSPSPSTSTNITFDSLDKFSCFNGPVQYDSKGADGEPLDNCGNRQSSYGVQSSAATSASTAATTATTNSGGGCAPFKFAPVAGTFADFSGWTSGDIDDGFTMTFGALSGSTTRGLAFAAVDNWYEASTNVDLVAKVLQTTLEAYVGTLAGISITDSDVKLIDWDLSGIYAVYFAVFFDVRESTILLVSTNDANEKLQVVRFAAPAKVFDGAWHQISIVASKTEGAYSTLRLFVDAATDYTGDRRLNFQRCTTASLSSLVRPVSTKPLKSMVTNANSETVFEGGSFSSFVGSAPPAIFNLQMHTASLRAVEQAGLGSQDMLNKLSLNATNSIIIGVFLGIAAVIILIMGIYQGLTEGMDDGSKSVETGDFGNAIEAGQEAGVKLAAGAAKKMQKFFAASSSGGGASASFGIVRRLTAMLTPLLAVFQQLALLFRGFTFPNIFEEPLSYITFLFSFQITLPEFSFTIPTWTPLAFLGSVAFLGVIIVLFFGWRDNEAFLETLKRYELLTKSNAEYAESVVSLFASSKDKRVSEEDAMKDGKAIAENGWLLDANVIQTMLGSVSEATAARVVKELGPRPRNVVESIIRRVLLLTRSKSCDPELARDVASLLLAASGHQPAEDDPAATPQDYNLTVEQVSSAFRKAGLPCTAKEARICMQEIVEASNDPSAVDDIALSGKSKKEIAYINKQKENLGGDDDDVDDIPLSAIACLAAEEKEGPSLDPDLKRQQHSEFRNKALKLLVYEAPFMDQYVSQTHNEGRCWNDLVKAANNLSEHGTTYKLYEVVLAGGIKLYNVQLSLPVVDEEKRQAAIKETGTAPAQEFFIAASVRTPDADTQHMRLKVEWENPLRCPRHDARLMKASDSMYQQTDEEKKPLYQCCWQKLPAIKTQKGLGPCRTDALFICSADDTCLYTMCTSCTDPGVIDEQLIELNTSYVNLKRDPSAFVSLVAFLFLQAVYLPITQNAMLILACHPTVQCEFPSCFDPLSDEMLSAAVVAGASLLLVTIGLPLYWFIAVSRRSSIVKRVFESPTQWEEFLELDETALANLYNKFEQDYMNFEPFLMISRSVGLVVAVSFTEPESLIQMVAVACVTLFNAILMSYTAPFIDAWIDILTKSDMMYSCGSVALLCFEQSVRILSPDEQEETVGIVMLAWGGFFFVIYFTIFYKTIISTYLDHRSVTKVHEFEREELMWLEDSNIDRRLLNLEKVLRKKEKFFGKNHLQCAITRAHMTNSCRDADKQQKECDACGEIVLQALEEEYLPMSQGKSNPAGSILSQFTFRGSHWNAWSGGKGLNVLGDTIRDAKCQKQIIEKLKLFLKAAKKESAARTNAFSLLVTIRVPIEKIDFSEKNLTQVYGRGANFRDCIFKKANLMGVNFTGSTFSDCDFSDAFTTGAIFGPDHKQPVQSVWSSVVAGDTAGAGSLKEMSTHVRTSVNRAGSRIAVSGFGRYVMILDAATGHKVCVSPQLVKPEGAKAPRGASAARKSPYHEKNPVFATYVPTSNNLLLVFCVNHIYKLTVDEETGVTSPFIDPKSDAANDTIRSIDADTLTDSPKRMAALRDTEFVCRSTKLELDQTISSIQFVPSGERFACSFEYAHFFVLFQTGSLHPICELKTPDSMPDWPLFTRHSDDIMICCNGCNDKEGAELGHYCFLDDISARIEQNLAAVTTEEKVAARKLKSNFITSVEVPDKFLFVTQDGTAFVQFNPNLRRVSVRRFPKKVAEVDVENAYYVNDEDGSTFKCKIPSSRGNLNSDLLCTFKIPSKDVEFFPMPDGISILIVGSSEGDNPTLNAKLFSLVSGSELGSMEIACNASKKRFFSRASYTNQRKKFVPHEGKSLDPSGTNLFVTARVFNDDDGLIDIYAFKVPLFFKEKSAGRAVIKSAGQNVARCEFAPDGNLIVLNTDYNLRVLDVENDPVELSVGTPSKSFEMLSVAPNPKHKLAVLNDDGHVQLWDLEKNEPLGDHLNNEEFDWEDYKELLMHNPTVTALSNDGKYVAVGAVDEGVDVWIWNTADRTLAKLLRRKSKEKNFEKEQKRIRARGYSSDDDDDTTTAATTPTPQSNATPKAASKKTNNSKHDDLKVEDTSDDENNTTPASSSSASSSSPSDDSDSDSNSSDGGYDGSLYNDFVSMVFIENDSHLVAIDDDGLCLVWNIAKEKIIYEGKLGRTEKPKKPERKTSYSDYERYYIDDEDNTNCTIFYRNNLLFVGSGQSVQVFFASAFTTGEMPTPMNKISRKDLEKFTVSNDGSTVALIGEDFFEIYDIQYSNNNNDEVTGFNIRMGMDKTMSLPKFMEDALSGCDEYDSASLSPDGSLLAIMSYEALAVWDVSDIRQFPSHQPAENTTKGVIEWEMEKSEVTKDDKNKAKEAAAARRQQALAKRRDSRAPAVPAAPAAPNSKNNNNNNPDAQEQQQQQSEKEQEQEMQEQEKKAMTTTVFGTEQSKWLLYRGALQDPESRKWVRAVDLSGEETEEQQKERDRKEKEQKAKREQIKKERREKLEAQANLDATLTEKELKKKRKAETEDAAKALVTRKKRTQAMKLHQKIDMVPASVVFRRIETSTLLTRYINNCIVQHVGDFCTTSPATDNADNDAVVNIVKEYHPNYFTDVDKKREQKDALEQAELQKLQQDFIEKRKKKEAEEAAKKAAAAASAAANPNNNNDNKAAEEAQRLAEVRAKIEARRQQLLEQQKLRRQSKVTATTATSGATTATHATSTDNDTDDDTDSDDSDDSAKMKKKKTSSVRIPTAKPVKNKDKDNDDSSDSDSTWSGDSEYERELAKVERASRRANLGIKFHYDSDDDTVIDDSDDDGDKSSKSSSSSESSDDWGDDTTTSSKSSDDSSDYDSDSGWSDDSDW